MLRREDAGIDASHANDRGVTGILLVIAVCALIAVLVVVAWRGRSREPVESLKAERRHDWEKRLTEPQEEALLAGVTRFRSAGHDLILYHEGAKLDVYEPPMVASLYALTDAFHHEGDAAKILERWAAHEQPGALHLRAGYVDQSNLAKVARDLVADRSGEIAGIEHTAADELRGVVEYGVRAGGAMNIVAIDLARVDDQVKRVREEDDKTPWNEIVCSVLAALVARDTDGVLWMRAPTAEERAIVRRALESR